MSDLRKAAKDILKPLKEQFQGPHDIARVSESDFPHLKFSQYDAAGRILQAAGYEYLADVELRDVSRSEGNLYHPTLIRKFLASSGNTVACTYLLRPRFGKLVELFMRGMRNMRWLATPALIAELLPQRMILDLETELDDECFVVTSNAEAAAMMTSPPTIDNLFFPYRTNFQDLVTAHEARITSIAAGGSIVRMRTYEDTIAMSRRQKRQKDAYRASIDWISREELLGMGDGRLDVSEALFKEIRSLLEEEASW